MSRRLPFEIPPSRAYSATPTAIRNRRYRERQRQAALACATSRGDGPATTSWFCICGWKHTGVGTLGATVGAFERHVKECLFGEPLQVIVRRRARVSP